MPNVSYCVQENKVHYNPIPPLLCTLTLNDGSTVNIHDDNGDGVITNSMTYSYKSTLVSAEIGNACTSIGQSAFSSCNGLSIVTIGDSVTSIGMGAFNGCSNLTSIDIPSSVTSIGDTAFYGCRGLTSVVIPDGVTSIDDDAFNYCSSLTSMIVNAVSPPTLGNRVFYSTNNCPIYVPSGSVDAYKNATNWRLYASRIQAIQ